MIALVSDHEVSLTCKSLWGVSRLLRITDANFTHSGAVFEAPSIARILYDSIVQPSTPQYTFFHLVKNTLPCQKHFTIKTLYSSTCTIMHMGSLENIVWFYSM